MLKVEDHQTLSQIGIKIMESEKRGDQSYPEKKRFAKTNKKKLSNENSPFFFFFFFFDR